MVREPILTTVAISDLRPTQITVGMREVGAKRQALARNRRQKGRPIPWQAHDPGRSSVRNRATTWSIIIILRALLEEKASRTWR